jgi:hypothetical protein
LIFGAKNDKGISTCDLVLQGKKTVTRRLGMSGTGRIYEVGKTYAVQPGRTKKQVARILILSNMSHFHWWNKHIANLPNKKKIKALQKEAKKEGFGSWYSLIEYFKKYKIKTTELIRYEFKLVE